MTHHIRATILLLGLSLPTAVALSFVGVQSATNIFLSIAHMISPSVGQSVSQSVSQSPGLAASCACRSVIMPASSSRITIILESLSPPSMSLRAPKTCP